MATNAGTSSIPTLIVSAPASAATSASYPPCAQTCLADATGSLPCAESDSACLCLHASTVESSVTSCLNASGACSVGEATSAAKYYNDQCLRLGFSTSEQRPAATGPIVTATGNPTRLSTYLPAASDSEPSSSSSAATSNGLSVPTIAGIAAGAALLVVCVITFLAFLYIRKRSKKGSNPTVTIESFDPSNPNNRLRKTVSLRQSALYDLDDPEWYEKLSPTRTSTDDGKRIEHEVCHMERKRCLPQTPNTPISTTETLTNNSSTFYKEDFDASSPVPLPSAKTRTTSPVLLTSQQPRSYALERNNRPPSITFLPSKSVFEANLTVQSLPGSRRVSVDQRSPTVTVISDAASFHNATASHSRATSRDTVSDFSDDDATDSEVAQVSVIQRSRPTTFKALASPAEYTSSTTSTTTTSNSSTHELPTRPQLLSKFSSGTTITTRRTAKPACLTLHSNTKSTSFTSPTSTYSRHASIHPKLSPNPLSQHPSPTTPTNPLSTLSPRAAATASSSPPPRLPSTPTQPFTFRPISSQLAAPTQSSTPTQRSPPANMSLFPRTTTTTTTTIPSSHAPPSLPPTTRNSSQGYTHSIALDPIPPVPARTHVSVPTTSSTLAPTHIPTLAQLIQPSNVTADATTANTNFLSGSSFGTFDFELTNPNFSDDFVVDFEVKRVGERWGRDET